MNENVFNPIDGSTSYFDFNEMKQAGFYRMVGRFSEAKNTPPQYYGDASMIVTATKESLAQIVVSQGGIIYFRTTNWNGNEWQEWYRLCITGPLKMYDLPVAEGFQGTIKYGKNPFDTVFIDLQHMAYASGSGPNGPIIGTLPEGYFNRLFSTSATLVVASDIGRSGYLRIEADGRLIVDCGDGGGTLTGWGGCVSFPLYTIGS